MGELSCFRCGADVPPHAPEGLCPACVLADVMAPVSEATGEDLTTRDSADAPSGRVAPEPRLQAGQSFGPYRIERLLGRGGMGDVYEAQHLAQRRRVALKVLNQRLIGADDRARFLQEGQLAASITHPNSVYVFGSEDIDGLPVIAMELLPGGTLKDRVKGTGGLSAAAAVDVILQVIAGLEAAYAAGILHRDIKPTNCLIDHDGTVKVGDFGVSISTTASVLGSPSGSGAFQGTPEFASPEQRRGDALDVRSDIFSVGATLCYLLTGQPPGARLDLPARVARIDDQASRFSRDRARTVPPGLIALIDRCLATDRAARPATYAQLRGELERFSSAVATPARIGLRFAAGAYDAVILFGIIAVVMATLVGSRVVRDPGPALVYGMLLPAVIYWGVLEGLWGRAYGKRACGLYVVTTSGHGPGVLRASLRGVVFIGPVLLGVGLASLDRGASRDSLWSSPISLAGFIVAIGVVCSTARPRNGYAGLHEVLSGTRVVSSPTPDTARARQTFTSPVPDQPVDRRVGPYDVMARVGATDLGELLLACDARLKRRVWIHVTAPHTPAVSPRLRDLNRPGRLHWLNGQRTDAVAWDAYDASEGAPLVTPLRRERTPWRTVRGWLLDLARELEAAQRDGSVEALALERVWVTEDGRAKLLDFRAPGAPAIADASAPMDTVSAQRFVYDVARRALRTPAAPLPLSASSCLHQLARGAYRTLADAVTALTALQTQPDRVTTRQRGMALGLGVVVLLFGAALVGKLMAYALGFLLPESLSPQGLTYRDLGELGGAVLGVVCAMVLHGGVWLRAFGIAVVTPDGREASRWRAAGRAAIAWSWAPFQVAALALGWSLVAGAVWGIKLIALLWAAHHPERGLQDRLAGTYLVPR